MKYIVEVNVPYDFYCHTCNHSHTCSKWESVVSGGITLMFACIEGAQKYIDTHCNYKPDKFRIATLNHQP